MLKNKIVRLYLNGSIHVSLAVFALIQMTFHFCKLPFDPIVSLMGFAGTVFSYNFIKYSALVYNRVGNLSFNLKFICLLSIICFLVSASCFMMLNNNAKLASILVFLVTLLYAIPIHRSVSNLRNLAGLKVYIVCFSWAMITLIIPVLNANHSIDLDIVIKFIQRFILVLILIGIFEIVDMSHDSKQLKTLPQTLGIPQTKIILSALLLPFFVLEFFKANFQSIQAYNNIVILLVTLFFIWRASPKRSQVYTLFWVESIPIIWYLIVVLESVVGI
ncbi:UbiA prenyltransferase family protein [Myroides sp. LJL115]